MLYTAEGWQALVIGMKKNLIVNLSTLGAGSDQIQNNNAGIMMIIRQLSIITNPTRAGCTCVVTPPTGIMDTSYFAGTGDIANGVPEYLRPGDFLKLTFTNGPANGVGIATYTYDEVLLP